MRFSSASSSRDGRDRDTLNVIATSCTLFLSPAARGKKLDVVPLCVWASVNVPDSSGGQQRPEDNLTKLLPQFSFPIMSLPIIALSDFVKEGLFDLVEKCSL
jgi:hypothetical protein